MANLGRGGGRAAAAAALTLLLGCASTRLPDLPALRAEEPRTPVILVPGATGAKLRANDSTVVWGRGRDLIAPHDGGYRTARPLDPSPASGDDLEAFEVIERISIAGIVRKPIYGPIIRLMERHGYRRGDLRSPSADDTFFLYPYDWRQDNVLSARRLFERLEGLRRVRGEGRLRVTLICQSSGTYICRYLAKYGGATLDVAESGRATSGGPVEIDKIILVGTANGGSLRMFRELHRGRRYVPLVGRRWQPETLFTFVSLFQDLPVYRDDLFLDEHGDVVDVDLFDPASWRRYGWSIYGDRSQRRLARAAVPGIFGDAEDRSRFLQWALERAQRVHAVLRRDPDGFVPPRYYLIQNVYEETPRRAVLLREGGESRLLFTGDRELRRRPYLHARASAAGDGHATLESQMYLSPRELEALAAEPHYVRNKHFEMILDPGSLRRLLEFLRE